jgi:hypothetical protein
MGLRGPSRNDPAAVERILQEIRAKVRPGEYTTISDLRDRLFDSVQLTRAELVAFVKAHGDDLFEKYLKRDNPRLRCDNYLMKPPEFSSSGGRAHG